MEDKTNSFLIVDFRFPIALCTSTELQIYKRAMNFFLRVLRDKANQCAGPVLPSRKGAGRRTLLLGKP